MLQAFHNSMIDNKGILDFQLVLNKEERTFTSWIGEVGFSLMKQQMKNKLMHLVKDTTDLIFLIDIIEENYIEPDDSTAAARDLRAQGFLIFELFSNGYAISFHSVVLYGFHWITVKKVYFRVCICKDGMFDLDSDDPAIAVTGTIYPNVDMLHVDAVFPFDVKATARNELTKLRQQPVKKPNGTYNDGFQSYITNFQNLTTDPVTLIDQFSLRLDPQIVTMILSIATIPTTIDTWINQSKVFHMQKMHIEAIKGRNTAPSFIANRSSITRNPNAMDVDAITLTKLTPAEQARCIHENRCFCCRETGHSANQCRTKNNPSSPRPQYVHTADTIVGPPATPPTPTPPATTSAINAYVRTLTTQGKSEAKVLQTLKMCYEEPVEEVAVTTTTDVSDL
ncbi:hypothetical protein OG21DRAFT_1491346 [Imleria badia]|nr:hypothetical protein OG21DRAFT_1491346 [Imleria badia]